MRLAAAGKIDSGVEKFVEGSRKSAPETPRPEHEGLLYLDEDVDFENELSATAIFNELVYLGASASGHVALGNFSRHAKVGNTLRTREGWNASGVEIGELECGGPLRIRFNGFQGLIKHKPSNMKNADHVH
jgi:hypothetical protein